MAEIVGDEKQKLIEEATELENKLVEGRVHGGKLAEARELASQCAQMGRELGEMDLQGTQRLARRDIITYGYTARKGQLMGEVAQGIDTQWSEDFKKQVELHDAASRFFSLVEEII